MSKTLIVGQDISVTEFAWDLEYRLREDNPEYPKIYIAIEDLGQFDPWTCSEDEARSAMRYWENDNKVFSIYNPWFKYKAAMFINEHREIIENKAKRNHGLNLMHCINWLFHYQLIAPPWLTVAFAQVCDPIFNLEATSWDTTLGKPVGRGVNQKRLDKIRERKKHIPLIGEFVQAKLRKTGNKTKSYMLAQRAYPHLSAEQIEDYHAIYLKYLKNRR